MTGPGLRRQIEAVLSGITAGHTVLLLEDEPDRHRWFRKRVSPHARFWWATTVPQAIQMLAVLDCELICLDHDLGTEPAVGRDVARWLIEHPGAQPTAHILVHSKNEVSGPKIAAELQAAGRSAVWLPLRMGEA